jgi:hypothetical protein
MMPSHLRISAPQEEEEEEEEEEKLPLSAE